MKLTPVLPRFLDRLLAPCVHLAIFVVGLQYSYYQVFSQFRSWDDEGTMMLLVQEVLDDPRAHDAFSGVYGPFYYLHKYAIYDLLNADVSHDINRWTTIALWGLVALACAVFVYRLSRSILLAALVQMQLVLHLRLFVNEPGHPHEIALILIAGALVLSSFVSERRSGLASMLGIGAAGGALLLVKVNVGAFLGAALALAGVLSLPRSKIVLLLRWLAAAVAVALPAAIMWRHLSLPWAWNYCVLTTSVIASSLAVAAAAATDDELRWSHVGAAAAGGVLAVAGVCAVVMLAWGQPLAAVTDTVFFRAVDFPSLFVIPAPVSKTMTTTSAVSVLLAFFYAGAARYLAGREIADSMLAAVKLAYGGFAFYSLHALGPSLLWQSLSVPFMWLSLVRTDTEVKNRDRFPRVFLCLLAAFQTLQAYPVCGSQATWAVFLVAPVAAVCVSDALQSLSRVAARHLERDPAELLPKWLAASIALILLLGAGAQYYKEADIDGASSAYWKQPSLGLPGSSRLHLATHDHAQIHWLVERINANCDGFVGMPGFSSLYFWTRIRPPGSIASTWMLFMDDEQQRAIVERMEAYMHPCVIHSPTLVKFWTGGRPLDAEKPLIHYITTQYRQVDEFGAYRLLVRNRRTPGPHT